MRVKKAAQLLGVREDDGEQAIRAAYRRLAIKWHPDKCKDVSRDEATRKFQEINQAFQALSQFKKTGLDEEVHMPSGRDRFADLAEMMLFFEMMMGSQHSRSSSRGGPGLVDVDIMFDFAFGDEHGHWASMDDYDYDDDYDDDDDDDYEDEDDDDEDQGTSFANAAAAEVPTFSSREEARKLTVGELKASLRYRDVDYSACLEKSEMLALLLEWEEAHGSLQEEAPSTKARRAARKKAQQKRKKERQKAERSAADNERRRQQDGNGDEQQGDRSSERTVADKAEAEVSGPTTIPSGAEESEDAAKRRYSHLRDEVLVDVANAVDAGDARGAARALEAAGRVGLEPGGQYRALFEHAARLVKAADERRDADAERQKAKEEAAKRKQDDKRARREARRKAEADKALNEERERERREAERREKKAAKKKEKSAGALEAARSEDGAAAESPSPSAAGDDDVSESTVVSAATMKGQQQQGAKTSDNGAAKKKSASKNSKPSAPAPTAESNTTAAQNSPNAKTTTGRASSSSVADQSRTAEGSGSKATGGATSDEQMDLEQLEAEQLRQVLQMSLDQAAKEEEERKAAARAVERADLASRRERERALQREWNSTQRRAAAQQTKAREADAKHEAELQRASLTASAVALSGLPGFEDIAGVRGTHPPASRLAGFGPPLQQQPASQQQKGRGNGNVGPAGTVSSQAAAARGTSTKKQSSQQQRGTQQQRPQMHPSPAPFQRHASSTQNFDEDDVLHLAEQSVAGVLDAVDDDPLSSSNGELLRGQSSGRAAPAAASAPNGPKLVGATPPAHPSLLVKGGQGSLEPPPAFARSASVGRHQPVHQRPQFVPEPPRLQRASSLQAHAPPYSSAPQHQMHYGAPAPAGAPGGPPPPPGTQRINGNVPLIPPSGGAHQRSPNFANSNASGSIKSQLLALGGTPLFIPQHHQSPSSPPGRASPLLQPGKQAPGAGGGMTPPPSGHPPGGGYARVVPGAPYPAQQQYGGVPRPAPMPYVAAPMPAQQPRWIPGDSSSPRGPRPHLQPPPNLYAQRNLATAPPFVPAHQRGVQQHPQIPGGGSPRGPPPPPPPPPPGVTKPPGAMPTRGVMPNVGPGSFPYGKGVGIPGTPSAPGGLGPAPTQQRGPPLPIPGAQRPPHMSGIPSSPNTSLSASQRSAVYASPRGAPPASGANPQLQRPGSAQQPPGGPTTRPLSGNFEASRMSGGGVGAARAQRQGPSSWSSPSVDDSLRLAMEMSRQSELADALSTLDDSPSAASLSLLGDSDLAATASASEWVPASARAKGDEQSGDAAFAESPSVF